MRSFGRRSPHEPVLTLTLAWAWAACGPWVEPKPTVPPSVAAEEVARALEEAVARAGQGDERAVGAWIRAHEEFEAYVEPALRARHDRRVVAEVELQFSVIRAELARGAGQAEVEALEARITELLGPRPGGGLSGR